MIELDTVVDAILLTDCQSDGAVSAWRLVSKSISFCNGWISGRLVSYFLLQIVVYSIRF